MNKNNIFRFNVLWILFGICAFVACNSPSGQHNALKDDWEQLQQKDSIVVLIENSASTYYNYQGVELGFDFELISAFAKDHGLKLKFKVMDDVDSMFFYLTNGKADIIASNLTYTALRDSMVDFSSPIYFSRQVLAQRSYDLKDPKLKFTLVQDTAGLSSKLITVHGYSVFYERLKQLENSMCTKLSIHTAPGTYSTDDLVRLVSEGKLESTITDESLMGILEEDYPNVDYHVQLSKPQPICWAFRNHSIKLKEKVDAWLKTDRTSLKIEKLRKKYFKINSTVTSPHHQQVGMPTVSNGQISPYDDLFKKEAEIIGWDWRLLAALSFQESGFDSNAVSSHGAFGLMQLMPQSAIYYQCDTNDRVKGNIHAAAVLLKEIDLKFKKKIKNNEERIKFVLASYNSGAGHVLDAMQIARKLNEPDTIWFQHVENTILLKSQREYYTMEGVRNGYCRCHETYHFVYRVLSFYEHFKIKLN
jgi:membrane-bound lytic murein transglycosylase F